MILAIADIIWVVAGGVVTSLIVSVFAPLIITRAANKRLDEVAEKAAEAAKLLKESNERQELDAKEKGRELKAIKTLVDGSLTAAMRNELAAVRKDLATSQSMLILLEEKATLHPSVEVAGVIAAKKDEIAKLVPEIEKLQKNLAEREENVKRAMEQSGGVEKSLVVVEGEVIKHDEDTPAAGDENRT